VLVPSNLLKHKFHTLSAKGGSAEACGRIRDGDRIETVTEHTRVAPGRLLARPSSFTTGRVKKMARDVPRGGGGGGGRNSSKTPIVMLGK